MKLNLTTNTTIFILFICILCLCLFLFFKKKNAQEQIQNINIPLAENIQKEITIKRNILIHKYKTPDNKTQRLVRYIPDDGSVKIEQNIKGEVSIFVQDKGFTLGPYLALVSNGNNIDFILGTGLVYYKRFSLGVGFGLNTGFGLSFSRKLDDLPILKNTSLLVFITKNKATLGVSVGF